MNGEHLSRHHRQQLQEQLKELHVTLLNLKVISTHAKALVDALAKNPTA